MKKTMLIGLILLASIASADLGIDYNAEGNYYDIYNDFHHYYIDAETGIDLTNDFYNFWSKKEFCLEAKKGPHTIKKCTTEIPLTWSTEENEFYVKLIGELDYDVSSADINLVYYLGAYDERITVTPQIRTKKNLDYLKFSVKDFNIRVKRDFENDYFRVDYPYYDEFPVSDGNYTEYYNVVDRYYNLFDDNGSNRENIDFWWDSDYYLNGEYLEWQDENLTTAFNLDREKDYVNVELTTGEIPKNSDFEMNFYWVDNTCRSIVGMNVIPAMYEGDQESVQCSWNFTGFDCPDQVRWQTNEGINGAWITLPTGDENSFGLNCGADPMQPKGIQEFYFNNTIFLIAGSCNQSTGGTTGSTYDYVECGDDANISDHLARCALYKNGSFVVSSINRNAICMEEITLGIQWIKPESDYTENGTDQNLTIEARTTCTKGYCGDTNSFLQWCEEESCNDWKDINSSTGKIVFAEGNNPIQGYDLNESTSYDLNWTIQITEDSNQTQTFELRIKALAECAPEKTTTGTDRTITTGNPPITTSDINANWQNFDANVHLFCEDVNNGSGCNETYYRIDLNGTKDTNYGDWTLYDSNVLISMDGNIGIQYYSIDNANNQETTKESFALIDKTTHTLLSENYLPQPSNAAKNLIKLIDGNLVVSYCYYTGYHLGDAYYRKSSDGLSWNSPIQINSDAGYCSGYYSENGTEPFRSGEGGIALTINSLDDLFFLFSEWNGIKAWTKILYSNQTWSDTTLINGNAGNSPNKDTLNIVSDSNDSINYIITQKSS